MCSTEMDFCVSKISIVERPETPIVLFAGQIQGADP